jgi:branched-chain amino acid transport system ATP-binding protein
VEENLLLGGYSVSHSRRRLSELMLDVWEMFPVLRDRRSTRAGQLSGGQQQMLAIGQALMSRPSLLMLDEPSGGLSPAAYGEVSHAVKRLHERSVGVLLVEQAIAASLAVADHVTVMDVGRLVFAGEARGLSASEIISRAFAAPARTDVEGRPTTDFQS